MDRREPAVEGKQSQQIFRPRRVLAAVMAAAGLLWLGIFAWLFHFDGVPLQTFLSAAFFVVFFGVAVAYYGRTRIEVDSRGITCRGMVRTRRFSFADIRKVDILPGPVTVYAIRGSQGFVHFTSFFRHHQYLARLLVERAGLSPLPA
ncbi:PH domain-containing protein [Corallococcus sp. AB049A]|uniref:PH domain-containing protein n=1 Tax=Corallococcus interemptor TaxID=2316720 RepID=A0A3A8R169_9BACT|nr:MULTISPECIES: PH domain-containing protein [Corallococcus]RKH53303.1 PH domain-containing protein [Corallococcus sp. AB050B]RKH73738.1 PH domain-containing protein [Corallococcus interemptor]RKI63604.1 PH domain-containing protein [Corallococcus sp. AB049A]